MRPVIGITVGEIINISTGKVWTPVIYGQFHTYTDAVVRAGGAPFVIPLIGNKATLRQLYEQCDGLLLSGGHDISQNAPKRSKSHKHFGVSPRRDKQETQLLKWALDDDKPVLGICRGLQLINVVMGGSLLPDISAEVKETHNHQAGIDRKDFHHLAHSLKLVPGSKLHAALRTVSISTNALHHQAVDQLGDGLVATAHAEDDVVEAIELPGKRFVVGIQSHPEALEAKTEQLWRKLFESFVDSAKAARQ